MRLDLSSSEGSRFFLINHTRLDSCPLKRTENWDTVWLRGTERLWFLSARSWRYKGCPLKLWKRKPIILGREEELEATLSSGFTSQSLTTVFSLLQSHLPQNASGSSWERKMTVRRLLSSSLNSMSCCLWMDRRWSGRRQRGEAWLTDCCAGPEKPV